MSGREVARRSGLTHPTALKALARLIEVGLVKVNRDPTGDLYQLDRHHALADPVARVFEAESEVERELMDFMRERLRMLRGKVEYAIAFGSAVWGGSTASSDIDLAVSCAAGDRDAVERALADLSDAVEQRYGNRVNALFRTRGKIRRTGVWKRIEQEGIPLIRSGGSTGS